LIALKQFGGFVDAIGDPHFEYFLSGEAVHFDVLVRRDDDRIGGGDVRGGQDVLRADRALGLDFDLVACFGGSRLQLLCRHIRVGDARRARRDSYVTHAASVGCSANAAGSKR
jgi:hypothetical protein